MSYIVSGAVGLFTGIFSGLGVGGGTLLMIYLTAFAGIAQTTAQGINLLYFLPTSLAALTGHAKNKLIDYKVAIPAIIAGVVFTVAAALLATAVDVGLLRKIFGLFMLFIGATELFGKSKQR